jgi:hypothetical protein
MVGCLFCSCQGPDFSRANKRCVPAILAAAGRSADRRSERQIKRLLLFVALRFAVRAPSAERNWDALCLNGTTKVDALTRINCPQNRILSLSARSSAHAPGATTLSDRFFSCAPLSCARAFGREELGTMPMFRHDWSRCPDTKQLCGIFRSITSSGLSSQSSYHAPVVEPL